MSLVRPSFSHNFLNRLKSCSIDSLSLDLILIMDEPNHPSLFFQNNVSYHVFLTPERLYTFERSFQEKNGHFHQF